MSNEELDERLIVIESALAMQEKFVEELNQVVIEQGKKIDYLLKQNKYLMDNLSEDVVKPIEEETPPPHY